MRWTRLVASGAALAAGLAASLTMGVAPSASGATAGPSVIEPSACTVSGPLMAQVAATGDLLEPDETFTQLTATDGHGSYAGVAYSFTSDGFVFSVVRRDASGAVRVLGRFVYENTSVLIYDGSVRVIGFDPWGGVVVAVQRTTTSIEQDRFVGIRYDRAGVRHDLQLSPAWLSAVPVGVADSGSILGAVRRTDGRPQVVIWRGLNAGSVSVLSAPGRVAQGFASNGDWFDSGFPSGIGLVHVHGTSTALPLADYSGQGTDDNNVTIQAAAGGSGYGYDGTSVAGRWTAAGVPPGQPVRPQKIGFLTWVTAAGRSNDVVGGYPGGRGFGNGPRVLVTATGKAYRLPPEYDPPFDPVPRESVDQYGRVTFVGTDRLPHLLTCPR